MITSLNRHFSILLLWHFSPSIPEYRSYQLPQSRDVIIVICSSILANDKIRLFTGASTLGCGTMMILIWRAAVAINGRAHLLAYYTASAARLRHRYWLITGCQGVYSLSRVRSLMNLISPADRLRHAVSFRLGPFQIFSQRNADLGEYIAP